MVYAAHRFPVETSSAADNANSINRPPIPNLLPATSVHPMAVAVPAFAATWLVLGAWIVFREADTMLVLVIVTVVLVMYGGMMLGGGAFAHDTTPERARGRTFTAFLHGRVDTATGSLTGRQALTEIATMPVTLALGGSVILTIAALTGF